MVVVVGGVFGFYKPVKLRQGFRGTTKVSSFGSVRFDLKPRNTLELGGVPR